MIHDGTSFQQSLEQMQRMLRSLAELRREVLPYNPRLFAVMAEGPLDYIRGFYEELEAYRVFLLAGSSQEREPMSSGG